MPQTVLITGGTRGIGKACSEKFLANGYNVIATYVKDESAAEQMRQKYAGRNFEALRCDASDYEQVGRLFEHISAVFGGVDILVNNAGIAMQKMLCDTTREEWDKIFDVNMGSMFNTVHFASGHMVREKWGRIVNVSSIWGMCGASCEVAYSASKAAVIGFTKALAKELGPSGICVNCVAPGVIDTDMNSALDDRTKASLAEETPLCRMGSADEVAEVVCFLCGGGAGFVTGQVISPNGGIVV